MNAARRICARAVLAALLVVFAAPLAAQVDALWTAPLERLHAGGPPIAAFRGRPMIVNFWARWCVPCREEFPMLASLHERRAGAGLAVVGVALDDNLANTREFADVYDIRYPGFVATDGGVGLLEALGNELAVVPYTMAVARDGRVLLRKLGPIARDELEALADRALAAP